MTAFKIYQVDAFTNEVFRGNPAAVCPLREWLPDALMQKIAAENNLSETAFFVPDKGAFHIRWFTPTTEVELCGHATLASAHVLFEHEGYSQSEIVFNSLSGPLKVFKKGKQIVMDFPVAKTASSDFPELLKEALGTTPVEYYRSGSFGMAVCRNEQEVETLKPDFSAMKNMEEAALIVTAQGSECDFVSRVFAPNMGIDEDPVTGSAHTRLIPFWAERLEKQQMNAHQISERKGLLQCEFLGERVLIGGEAVTYLVGEIYI